MKELVLIDSDTLEELKSYAGIYITIRDVLPLQELQEMTEQLQSGAEWDAVLTDYLKDIEDELTNEKQI